MNLFSVMLYTSKGAPLQIVCHLEQEDALPVERETPNCWYLEDPPQGFPYKCLKSKVHTLISNPNGVYMFGTSPKDLIAAWNKAVTI